MAAAIYLLARGVGGLEWPFWLCPPCAKERRAAGWDLRGRRRPKYPLTCDDCKTKGGPA